MPRVLDDLNTLRPRLEGSNEIALANYHNDVAGYWEWSATGLFPVNFTSDRS